MTYPHPNEPSPRLSKAIQLNEKMLALAQELLAEELATDTLMACGHGFTYRLVGEYGRYETFNGEVVAFDPQFNVNFTLICDEFVVTSSLAMITTISYQLLDYDLAISR